MTPGIHLLHKPEGPTSFSLVRACMASNDPDAGYKLKICHGGTLDPFASGLLLILVGSATRLFEYLHAVPKVYEATVRWGIETDNGDPLGKVVHTGDASGLSEKQLIESLVPFIGWHEQTPHATSNKRIEGERAYHKAHRGENVDLPPQKVYLHDAVWLSHDLPRTSRMRLTVRGGYYVRSMVRDLGRQLGCGAHLEKLHRVSIGPWNDPGPDRMVELHGRELLPWLPARKLTDDEIGELRKDRDIPAFLPPAPDWPLPPGFPARENLLRGFHRDKLCFLLELRDARLHPVVTLRGGL